MTPLGAAGLTLLVVLALAAILGRPLLSALGFRLIRRRKRKPSEAGPLQHSAPAEESQEDDARGPAPRDGLAQLSELEVSDVMVHRLNMRSINAADPPEQIVRALLNSPHTRMPLWEGSLDNIVGVLHAKDVLRALNDAGNDFSKLDIMAVAMKPWFVPDTTSLEEQLAAFLRRKSHFAIVVDEYGEVEGLVTLEDIMEEIVGDIADEHDLDVQGVKQEADGSIVVDGAVPIRDLNRALGWTLPDDEATTIAGLVIHEAQSIPDEKQAFTFHGKRFVVMRRQKNRITRIRIRDIGSVAASA
ncbi:MAG: CBS domain-containing protein [Rhizobiaceae bacterium]|nr:CBS domain-containing protein [Rhizobiaceae bacterium]